LDPDARSIDPLALDPNSSPKCLGLGGAARLKRLMYVPLPLPNNLG